MFSRLPLWLVMFVAMFQVFCLPAFAGGSGIEMVHVKGGCFQMGDVDDLYGVGAKNAKPVHEVCVDDFAIGKFEVTQGQWKAIMGSNPSYFKECGDKCPVESVSWNDVQEFINRLNERTGKRYRLPTEAEWEYAARGGDRNNTYAGTSHAPELENYAWSKNNSQNTSHPVGKKMPNRFGIYDMSGNVVEYVADLYDETYYENSPRNNPGGPESGTKRVVRGGSWKSYFPVGIRATNRNSVPPDIKGDNAGFRLAQTP